MWLSTIAPVTPTLDHVFAGIISIHVVILDGGLRIAVVLEFDAIATSVRERCNSMVHVFGRRKSCRLQPCEPKSTMKLGPMNGTRCGPSSLDEQQQATTSDNEAMISSSNI